MVDAFSANDWVSGNGTVAEAGLPIISNQLLASLTRMGNTSPGTISPGVPTTRSTNIRPNDRRAG